jgi:hypothetical protein
MHVTANDQADSNTHPYINHTPGFAVLSGLAGNAMIVMAEMKHVTNAPTRA